MLLTARRLARHLPPGIKRTARRIIYRGGHPGAPSVKTAGTIQDLYLWIADGDLDTIVPLQNYFSVFFPQHDTTTSAHVEIYGADGRLLGTTNVPLPHLATPMFRVSELLDQLKPNLSRNEASYGNLLWHIAVPQGVADEVGAGKHPFLFWDRSYIGYLSTAGGACFVHGVDKYDVRPIDGEVVQWMGNTNSDFTARPEIPIDIAAYTRLEVVVQNRATDMRNFRLEVTDSDGAVIGWDARVAPRGVHRFMFSEADTTSLATDRPLALRVSGLPTRYGRPILLKRFATGGLSIMHC